MYIICSYLPPSSCLATVNRLLDAINFIIGLSVANKDKIVVVGDFNQPGIAWVPADIDHTHLIPASTSSSTESEICDRLHSFGLYQLNHVLNHLSRSLDLVFCNFVDDISVSRSSGSLVPEDNYHPSLDIFCNIKLHSNFNVASVYKFDYKNSDYTNICADLASHDWTEFLNGNDIDTLCIEFYHTVFLAIYKYTPVVLVKTPANDYCTWISPATLLLIKQKNKAYSRWRISRLDSDLTIMKNLRIILKRSLTSAYYSYLNNIQCQLNSDPNKFWQFIKAKNKSDGFPNDLELNGVSSDDPLTIANLFASFFQSVYVSDRDHRDLNFERKFDYIPMNPSYLFNDLSFSDRDILDGLNNLELNFNSGPDGLSSGFLRKCAVPLHHIICKLFNVSMCTGSFPSLWKLSHIIPIFKSGRKNKIVNYRGISLQSALPKVFDALVCDRLYVVSKRIICHNQHGFMRKRSTVTNLLAFTDFVTSIFSINGQVDTIYTDFSKAFDKVSHSILLLKLSRLGFPDFFVCWLSSFLSGRTQSVKFRNSSSVSFNVTSGVPQGSHIGPLLFILFINDITTWLPHGNVLMFADDLKIFMPVTDADSSAHLQFILTQLYNWCEINRLPPNIDKCSVVTFSRRSVPTVFEYFLGGKVLPRSSCISDLGVLLDTKLEFRDHIDNTITRANKMWGMIRRYSGDFVDPYAIKSLYIAFVRSLLEYAAVIWSPYYTSHINRIEGIQKRFLRYALRRLHWRNPDDLPSYNSRLLLINLLPLAHRRVVARNIFVFRLLTGDIDAPDLVHRLNIHIPSAILRHHRFFIISTHRSNFGNRSALNGLLREFNNNYNLIDFHLSVEVIKRRLLGSPIISG